MKRYEVAKKQGLNWQVVLIQDTETDIKLAVLNGIRNGIPYFKTNAKINKLVGDCIENLESEELKSSVKNSLPLYASRIYIQTIETIGDKRQATELLTILANSGVIVPKAVEQRLTSRISPDKPKATSYNRAVANNVYDKTYGEQVKNKINKILDSTAKEDYTERTSLRATAERQVRQEWHEHQLEELNEKGVELVWIDSHSNCSKRCEEWQGKLYSLNHTSGTKDGVKFQPLENATDIYYTTKAGKVWKNGCISGFGCRHKLVEYKKGFRPQTIPSSVIDKQRNIDSKMREMERTIRIYETRALGWKGQDASLYRQYKNLANKWVSKYEKFAKDNNVAFYPSRIEVL